MMQNMFLKSLLIFVIHFQRYGSEAAARISISSANLRFEIYIPPTYIVGGDFIVCLALLSLEIYLIVLEVIGNHVLHILPFEREDQVDYLIEYSLL